MGRIEEAYKGLTAEQKAQSDHLRERLTELGVKEGIQARLQGLTCFGSQRSMIWKLLADLYDPKIRGRIKDVGSYLWTCLAKGPRWKEDGDSWNRE